MMLTGTRCAIHCGPLATYYNGQTVKQMYNTSSIRNLPSIEPLISISFSCVHPAVKGRIL